jgi:hypothetical protein
MNALALVVAGGCGGAYAAEQRTAAGAQEPPGSVEDYQQRIATLQHELAQRLGRPQAGAQAPATQASPAPPPAAPADEWSGAAPSEAEQLAAEPDAPDCDAAADLRARICELANRICAIADRNAGDAALADTCDRARTSCEQATADVRNSCGT